MDLPALRPDRSRVVPCAQVHSLLVPESSLRRRSDLRCPDLRLPSYCIVGGFVFTPLCAIILHALLLHALLLHCRRLCAFARVRAPPAVESELTHLFSCHRALPHSASPPLTVPHVASGELSSSLSFP